jgi:hypothetical protein
VTWRTSPLIARRLPPVVQAPSLPAHSTKRRRN